jgi:hypothetical protein
MSVEEKALRFDLDRAGIEQRDSEAVELAELRAECLRLRRLLEERGRMRGDAVLWISAEQHAQEAMAKLTAACDFMSLIGATPAAESLREAANAAWETLNTISHERGRLKHVSKGEVSK